MQYMCLIYADPSKEPVPGTSEFGELMKNYEAFSKEVEDAGVFVSGNALQPTNLATTVRGIESAAVMTDGPFAETKETLGGYYLLDCKDLDQAIHYAAKIPSAAYGCVEVRPVMTFD